MMLVSLGEKARVPYGIRKKMPPIIELREFEEWVEEPLEWIERPMARTMIAETPEASQWELECGRT
jgi:predicted metal-dependent hydrolase